MNIFRFFFYFLFKSFLKIELRYVFAINMFITAENCMQNDLSNKKKGDFSLVMNYLRPSNNSSQLI